MTWLNQWEIEEALHDCAKHPILSKATRVLHDLMCLTNEVSDGWPYWRKPARAASKLMELIECHTKPYRYNDDPPEVTEADLKRALIPIKAFLTREAKHLRGQTITLPY